MATTTTRHALFNALDGLKAVDLNDLPESAWTRYGHTEDDTVQSLYSTVPWLWRAVGIRAQALSVLPFTLWRGETEYDMSDTWQNTVGFLPEPSSMLYVVEASLCLTGSAYLFRERNRVKTLALRYLVPSSITPVIDEQNGLTGFKRRLESGELKLKVDDLVHFWLLDPFVEVGPGACPADAALKAAAVMYNVDEFAAAFFKRGAIKSTLLTIEGGATEQVKSQLKSWWQRMFRGTETAWETNVINAAVKPVQIGEGVAELQDTELTSSKREDIATALGVPQTMLFSNAANYATAQEDRLSFYVETVIPDAKLIESALNAQLFSKLGLRWEFKPETLDVFQADEQERSQAFLQYVQAGMKMSIAAEMLGLELPQGVEYADLDPEEKPEPPTIVVNPFGAKPAEEPEEEEVSEQAKADLKRWKAVARKRLKEGQDPAAYEFQSAAIPAEVAAQVRAMLDGATTDEEVKAAFAAPFLAAVAADDWPVAHHGAGYP